MARKPSKPLIDEQIMDQAFSELAALVEESERLLGDNRRFARGAAIRRRLDQALQRGTELANQLGEHAEPTVRQAEGYVRKNPIVALALAAGLGVVAAALITRRD